MGRETLGKDLSGSGSGAVEGVVVEGTPYCTIIGFQGLLFATPSRYRLLKACRFTLGITGVIGLIKL